MFRGTVCVNEPNDVTGATPLHVACQENLPEMVTVLLDAAAELSPRNRKGMTPLHAACAKGHVEAVQALLPVLIACGGDVDEALPDGTTALWLICLKGHAELFDIYLNERRAAISAISTALS